MLKILAEDRLQFVLQDILPVTGPVSVAWWNPDHRCITNVRHVSVRKTMTREQLQELLEQHPEWRIASVLSHECTPTKWDEELIASGHTTYKAVYKRQQVMNEDATPYIDEFGYYVYIRFRVGAFADVDTRYEDTNAETDELFTVKHTL